MENTTSQFVEETTIVREISHQLSRSSGWMRFLGIIMIIMGGVTALSIIGIIFAWLPVWMGILLIRAANNAKEATTLGDKELLGKALLNINNYFTIYGILVIVSLLLTILGMLIIYFTGISLFDLNSFNL